MQVYLVRHGTAASQSENLRRGLTEEGKGTVRRLAQLLEARDLDLECIEHSGKLRVQQTAEILAERLRPRKEVGEAADLAPNDDPAIICDRLREPAGNLMLVGHLPHLARVASTLLQIDEAKGWIEIHAAGLIRLDRGAEGWVLRWLIQPEILQAANKARPFLPPPPPCCPMHRHPNHLRPLHL